MFMRWCICTGEWIKLYLVNCIQNNCSISLNTWGTSFMMGIFCLHAQMKHGFQLRWDCGSDCLGIHPFGTCCLIVGNATQPTLLFCINIMSGDTPLWCPSVCLPIFILFWRFHVHLGQCFQAASFHAGIVEETTGHTYNDQQLSGMEALSTLIQVTSISCILIKFSQSTLVGLSERDSSKALSKSCRFDRCVLSKSRWKIACATLACRTLPV